MWAQASSGSPQEHARRAHQFLAEKKPELAIPEFRAVLTADPADLDAQANLGVLLFFRGDYAGAAPLLKEAVTQKPELSKIRALLGLSEKSLGQAAEARQDFEAAVPQLTEPAIRIQAGLALVEIDVAAQDLEHAAATVALLRQVAPTDPRVLYTAYRIATDEASEAMLSLSIAAPDSAQMHQAMAHELERARDLPATIANLRKAAELDPALPGINYELAEALRSSDDLKLRAEAEAQYKLALERNPQDARSAAQLGDLAAGRSDLPAAAARYRQALAIDPKLPEAELGLAYVDTQNGDFAAAAPMLEQVIAADPTNALAHFRLSVVYRKLNRPDDAKRELAAYQRYKEIRERMRTIYKQMRQEAPEDDTAAAKPGEK
jgi:Tfp pilus assembly protein PilF